MPDRPKISRALVIFTGAYLLAAGATTLHTGSHELFSYGFVMVVLIAIVYAIHRRCHLPGPLLWALSGLGLCHMAGGLIPIPSFWPHEGRHSVLYSLWLLPDVLKYDQVVHAYGFGITTWLCWATLRASLEAGFGRPIRPTICLMVLCAAAGMGFGALNEVNEFITTLTLPDTNVGGYVNTGWDLIYNAVGSIFAATIIYFRHP